MKVTNTTFSPSMGTLYVAVCTSGRQKDKEILGLLCTNDSTQDVETSSDYDLYRSVGDPISPNVQDVQLDLTLKDSTNVITVGVPEDTGVNFPISVDGLPKVFSLN